MNVHQSANNNFQYKRFEIPFWLRNPHLQTMLPKFLVKDAPQYRRELWKDSYDVSQIAYDFYDAHDDHSTTSTTQEKTAKPLVVMFHGLEGSSQSHYAITMAHQVHAMGWHYVVVHYRSCGGVPASGTVFYNAGDSAEIQHVLSNLSKNYANIHAIGVSLGGNMLAKYMGEYQEKVLCHSAVVVSAPLDLASSSVVMRQGMGKYLYTPYLLNPLVKKALATPLTTKESKAIEASKNFYEFDHVFTAPRHGFCSANDYYHQCAALPVLKHICKPTLIITATDDPFLGSTATEQDISSSVSLIKTNNGGHIGFVSFLDDNDTNNKQHVPQKIQQKFNLTWFADVAIDFFQQR